MSTPGLEMGDLLGQHGSPEANRLVAEEMGKLFTTKIGKQSIGDYLATSLQHQNLTPEGRRMIIQWIYQEFKKGDDGIIANAIRRNPMAFTEESIKSEPDLIKNIYREAFKAMDK